MRLQALRSKIVLLFLGTILFLSISIAVLLYAVSIRIFEQKAYDNIDYVAITLNNNISTLTREIQGITVRSSLNTNVKTLLDASNANPDAAISRNTDLQTVAKTISFIENEQITKNHVRSISLFNSHFQEIMTLGEFDRQNHYTPEFGAYTFDCLTRARAGVYYNMYTGLEGAPTANAAVLEVYSPLFDLTSLTTMGYLRITYAPAVIFNNYSTDSRDKIISFLSDGNRRYIYHPEIASHLNYFPEFFDAALQPGRNSLINNTSFLISGYTTPLTNMNLIVAYPFTDVIQETLKIYIQIMLTIIVILAALFLLFNRALRHILSPVQSLTGIVLSAAPENNFAINELTEFTDHLPTNDEIKKLSHSFKQMTGQVNTTLHELEVSYSQKQELELQLLQSQINPHFLYNSIDSICGLTYLKAYDEIFSMAKNLGSFYKLSLKKGEIYTTIESELQHVESYLNIEQIRNQHSFQYSIKCAPECRSCRIIKIILQPIVENAVLHGIRGYDKPGYIHITCAAGDDRIVFKIFNNGFPFRQDLAEIINSGFVRESADFGFGIRNVYQRLKLYYHGAATMHYDVDDGTLVTITIQKTHTP